MIHSVNKLCHCAIHASSFMHAGRKNTEIGRDSTCRECIYSHGIAWPSQLHVYCQTISSSGWRSSADYNYLSSIENADPKYQALKKKSFFRLLNKVKLRQRWVKCHLTTKIGMRFSTDPCFSITSRQIWDVADALCHKERPNFTWNFSVRDDMYMNVKET